MRRMKASEAVGKRVRVKKIDDDFPSIQESYSVFIDRIGEIDEVDLSDVYGTPVCVGFSDGADGWFRFRELELVEGGQ